MRATIVSAVARRPAGGAVAEGVDPARSHGADPAAGAELAVAALGLLLFVTLPDGCVSFAVGDTQHLLRGRIDTAAVMTVACLVHMLLPRVVQVWFSYL
ncbi:hypothetical protein [Geobacter sulfurreducens]|uniref:hypothetical protein n=1 Tax=Geobacter sulfurreducens TaxID=35554 RepID=UPI001EE6927A|nr:hypothetical protein [Geobacter sulfurreducens]